MHKNTFDLRNKSSDELIGTYELTSYSLKTEDGITYVIDSDVYTNRIQFSLTEEDIFGGCTDTNALNYNLYAIFIN